MKASDTVMSETEVEYIRNSTVARDMVDSAREQGFKAGLEEGYNRGVNMKPNPDGVYENGFNDGKRAGIKEVVEWLDNQYDGSEDMWQSKLKEWGCL